MKVDEAARAAMRMAQETVEQVARDALPYAYDTLVTAIRAERSVAAAYAADVSPRQAIMLAARMASGFDADVVALSHAGTHLTSATYPPTGGPWTPDLLSDPASRARGWVLDGLDVVAANRAGDVTVLACARDSAEAGWEEVGLAPSTTLVGLVSLLREVMLETTTVTQRMAQIEVLARLYPLSETTQANLDVLSARTILDAPSPTVPICLVLIADEGTQREEIIRRHIRLLDEGS